jgi:predicted MFS family arabinose efflux permease
LAQGGFLELYNLHYAKKQNLSEIDSNASASPMKIIQNLANVLGLTLGGLLLAMLSYSGFFIAFGVILVILFIFSMIHRAQLSEI